MNAGTLTELLTHFRGKDIHRLIKQHLAEQSYYLDLNHGWLFVALQEGVHVVELHAWLISKPCVPFRPNPPILVQRGEECHRAMQGLFELEQVNLTTQRNRFDALFAMTPPKDPTP